MRQVPAAAALLLLFSCGRETGSVAGEVRRGGDIILVTIDTWRHDAAGFAGNRRARTPYLDSLSERGVLFRNAHAHNVVTLPSHATILTGLHPYEHGIRDNSGFVLDAKWETVAETLKNAGYATGAFVASYPLDAKFGLNQGFDRYDDAYGKGSARAQYSIRERPAPAVLDAAAQWWNTTSGRKRFLWVHFFEPHAPYAPPPEFAEATGDPYLGEVAAVDAALGRVIPSLADADTTIIVTADHGEALGDHGELTHGLFAYESTLKVPLVVVSPRVKPRIEEAAVRHIDITPTILDAAGLAARGLPGLSLLGEIGERETYFEALSANLNRGWAPLTGIMRRQLKYIDLPIAELYDLASDPKELRNVRSEKRREAQEARRLLESRRGVAAEPPRSISAEEAATLRSLGYVAGAAAAKATYSAADDPKNLVSLDAKLHRAIDAQERGRGPEALRLIREVVAARPDMIAGRELLAHILLKNGRTGEAIDALVEAVGAGAGAESRLQLANLLTETGRGAEAATILAPLAGGDDPDVLNAYGVALARSGRSADAVAQFKRVLQIEPDNPPALQNLGIVALERGEASAARQYLSRALALNPQLPLALNAMGVLHAQSGEHAAAIGAWRNAVALDPQQYDALFNLALVATRSGRHAEAVAALEQFVQTAPPERYGRDIAAARDALRRLRARRP